MTQQLALDDLATADEPSRAIVELHVAREPIEPDRPCPACHAYRGEPCFPSCETNRPE